MNDAMNRYLDFSTDEEDIDGFRPGVETHPALAHYAGEIQRFLKQRNPITALRGLTALQAVTEAGFLIGQRRSRNVTNILLGVIAALLTYIAAAI